MEDVVRSLGLLCLGTRLKRIGEQLQQDAQALLEDETPALPASQHPLLAALDRLGPLTIGDLALALGVTQPGVTRHVSRLTKLRLVELDTRRDDQRQRVVRLSPSGQQLVDMAKRSIWPRLEGAVADLCAGLDGPLLVQLAAIEDGLKEASLAVRAERVKGSAR